MGTVSCQLGPLFIFLVLMIPTATSSAARDTEEDQICQWIKYKAKYGKVFSQSEDERRFAIWKSNVEVINKHNQRFSRGIEAYQLEPNRFADYPPVEFKKLFGFVPSPSCLKSTFDVFNFTMPPKRADDFPDVDHRNSSCMGPVKTQGSCGSCYAFATAATLEFCGCKKNKGKYKSLSVQEVVDCSSPPNKGCTGGSLGFSFQYMQKSGLVPNQFYPYTAKVGNCNRSNAQQFGQSAIIASRIVNVPSDEDFMAAALARSPLAVAIKASCASFAYYSKGIYSDAECCNNGPVDHAALLVGMGTDSGGNKYWLIRNSWGPDWGERGYIRIARGINMCGVNTSPTYVTC